MLRRRKADQQKETEAWERTRWQTWQLINIHLPLATRLDSPRDLLRLPSDGPAEADEPTETPEELQARLRLLDADKTF